MQENPKTQEKGATAEGLKIYC